MTIEGSYGCFILTGKGGAIRSNCKTRVALLFAHTTSYCVHNISAPRAEYVELAALFSDSQSLVTCIMIA